MTQRQHSKSHDEPDDLGGSWGSLIDQGLRQAKDTLVTLDTRSGEVDSSTREAWALIGRAFESSASALRALTT